GVDVPVGRLVHVPRRADPVQGEGQVLEAHDRSHLLLADVVGPAATVAALGAADRREHQHGAVDLVGVVPVVGAGSHEDHAAALGVDGVLRPLTGDPHDLLDGRSADLGRPRGGGGHGRVLVAGGPPAGEPVAADAVVGEHEVQDGGDQATADAPDGHTAPLVVHVPLDVVEPGQEHLDGLAGVA